MTVREFLFPLNSSLAPIALYNEGEARTKHELITEGTRDSVIKGQYKDYKVIDWDTYYNGCKPVIQIFIIISHRGE
jgi:hypothetical protein